MAYIQGRFFVYFLVEEVEEVSDEHRLFRKLMKSYEKSVRPVINSSSTGECDKYYNKLEA